MADLQVQGSVMEWARLQAGLTPAVAAKRLKLTASELSAIETHGSIVLPQRTLSRIAKQYKLPYGSLFMPQPLPIVLPRNYRTFRGLPPTLSEITLRAWSDVNEAVDGFADLLDLNPQLVQVPTLPTITRSQDIEATAAIERSRLRITLAEQYVWTDVQARDAWRRALETVGVFVYFVKMPRRDCMGFSVIDDRGIPAICVNDAPEILERQKIFTMLHEHCHLLLRRPGISDQGKGNAVERFCNQFAAAVLVPREALRAVLPGGGPNKDWSTRDIRKTATRFTVSMEVIALRIEELKMADPGFYDRKVKEWNALKLLQKRISTSHPNVPWPARAAKRLGRKHTSTVFDALDHGAISYAEAHGLIGLPPKYFADIKAATG